MPKKIAILFIILSINGCHDRYRYECQDPKNWQEIKCKPPLCEVTETCPSMLQKVNREER